MHYFSGKFMDVGERAILNFGQSRVDILICRACFKPFDNRYGV